MRNKAGNTIENDIQIHTPKTLCNIVRNKQHEKISYFISLLIHKDSRINIVSRNLAVSISQDNLLSFHINSKAANKLRAELVNSINLTIFISF